MTVMNGRLCVCVCVYVPVLVWPNRRGGGRRGRGQGLGQTLRNKVIWAPSINSSESEKLTAMRTTAATRAAPTPSHGEKHIVIEL